jgi:hypothetical protein
MLGATAKLDPTVERPGRRVPGRARRFLFSAFAQWRYTLPHSDAALDQKAADLMRNARRRVAQ